MMKIRSVLAAFIISCFALPASAQDLPPARAVIAAALEAHGGDAFREPATLQLRGSATFYDPETGEVRSQADDYRMWREFDADRRSAHGAEGKVRIIALSGGEMIFEIGYDGETTWTQDGIMPREVADAYWASNFGFGIIRSALDDGFAVHNAPTRDIGGRATHMVRIVDPQGQETLFGVDAESRLITYMAFTSPRGFHERLYGDFVRLPDSGWVQASRVSLLYDGVLANTVFWDEAVVGEAIEPAVFMPPVSDAN